MVRSQLTDVESTSPFGDPEPEFLALYGLMRSSSSQGVNGLILVEDYVAAPEATTNQPPAADSLVGSGSAGEEEEEECVEVMPTFGGRHAAFAQGLYPRLAPTISGASTLVAPLLPITTPYQAPPSISSTGGSWVASSAIPSGSGTLGTPPEPAPTRRGRGRPPKPGASQSAAASPSHTPAPVPIPTPAPAPAQTRGIRFVYIAQPAPPGAATGSSSNSQASSDPSGATATVPQNNGQAAAPVARPLVWKTPYNPK